MTATDGHTNIGRMVAGAALGGVVGAGLAHSRTEGVILVAWQRNR